MPVDGVVVCLWYFKVERLVLSNRSQKTFDGASKDLQNTTIRTSIRQPDPQLSIYELSGSAKQNGGDEKTIE